MMMKEHIVDTYGEIRFTMGNGCSGGSIQPEHGRRRSIPACSTASSRAATSPTRSPPASRSPTACCSSTSTSRPEWTGADGRPDAGADQRQEDRDQRPPRPDRLPGWNNAFGFNNKPGQLRAARSSPTATRARCVTERPPRNNCLLPAALVYDPVTNPTGTRCGDPDLAAAVWGTTQHRAGVPARQRACAVDQRQRRRAVRAEGAARRRDHGRRSS